MNPSQLASLVPADLASPLPFLPRAKALPSLKAGSLTNTSNNPEPQTLQRALWRSSQTPLQIPRLLATDSSQLSPSSETALNPRRPPHPGSCPLPQGSLRPVTGQKEERGHSLCSKLTSHTHSRVPPRPPWNQLRPLFRLHRNSLLPGPPLPPGWSGEPRGRRSQSPAY